MGSFILLMIRLRFPRSIGSIKKLKKRPSIKNLQKKADNKSPYDVLPCIASQYKHTPLHYVASKNNVSEARCLISSGADVDALGMLCYTPLQWAASKNHLEMVKFLITKGANLNVVGHGSMPLHSAIIINKVEIVKVLIANDADVNATNERNHRTPLMVATYFGHIPIIQLLFANGADVNIKNFRGVTALGIALKNGKEKVAIILRRRGAKE